MSLCLRLTAGPQGVSISGPDIVTIGIPYGFSCSAEGCNPSCLFTMTLDGQTKFSSEFDITFKRIVTSEVLTCEAKDPETGETANVSKTIQVAGTMLEDVYFHKKLMSRVKFLTIRWKCSILLTQLLT